MSDHAWSQENVAAYLAGGLTAAEAERLDAHARECPDCAAALDAARHLDRALGTLFAPVRPKPGLEDRAIQAVRTAPRPHTILMVGWVRRVMTAAALLIVVTTFGALAASMMNDGRLPLPGQERRASADRIQREAETGRQMIVTAGLPMMSGRDDSESVPATKNPKSNALNHDGLVPDVDRMAEKAANDIVTADPIGVPHPREENTAAMADPSQPAPKPADGITDAFTTSGTTATTKYAPAPLSSYYAFNGPVPPGSGGMGFAGVPGGYGIAGGMVGSGGLGTPPGVWTQYETTGAPGRGFGAPMTGIPPAGNKAAGPSPAPPGTTYFEPHSYKLATGTEGKDKSGLPDGKQQSAGDNKPSDPSQKNGGAKPDDRAPPQKSGGEAKPDPKGTPATTPAPEQSRRIIIRSGDIEFEIESFDSSLATITKLVTGIKGAFVATVNSEKLPNGKVRGSVTVRTPPEHLDGLVLDLRRELGKGGELKGVKISSQDITKQYTDLESRLRAARAMETRLLAIIKEGKGEIKQLLEAERELGVWRTKIEEYEGDLRYYANLAAFSTLNITLTEKEIRVAVGVTESERVQAGVEVEDVDKTYQQVLAAVVEAKGRVTKSELKQLSAGQYNASLNFEVPPESGGPLRDRLRQLGRVARLEIDRVQQSEGGPVPKDAKVTRGNTVFMVQLYNLANIAPRETDTLQVAVADVPAAYQTIRNAIAKAAGRVQVAQLNEQNKQNVTAQLDFEVKRTDEAAIQAALTAAGEATSRFVARAPESDNVTDTKVLYKVTLFPAAGLKPRDTAVIQVVVPDVSAAYQALRAAVGDAKGRVMAAQLNEQDKQNVTAQLDFEVKRQDEAAVRAVLDNAGEVVSRQVTRAAENEAATDAKVLYRATLLPANRLKPRETTTLAVEVQDVDQTTAAFASYVAEAKGRQVDAKSARERNGRTTARLVYEVPLAAAPGLVEKFKSAGTVRVQQSARDPQAPEGKSAVARIDVTLTNAETIVPADTGLWQPVRKGLSYSASVLLTSMTWVVFGLCVVLPWALVGYGGYRVVRHFAKPTDEPVTPPAPPPSPPAV